MHWISIITLGKPSSMRLLTIYFVWRTLSQLCKWDKMNEEHDSYLKYDCCRKLTTSNSDFNQPGGWTGNVSFLPETPRLRGKTATVNPSVQKCGISVSHLALSFWAFILRGDSDTLFLILPTRVNRTALLADFLQGFVQDFSPGWGNNIIVITI